jgi:hypothetical protein
MTIKTPDNKKKYHNHQNDKKPVLGFIKKDTVNTNLSRNYQIVE